MFLQKHVKTISKIYRYMNISTNNWYQLQSSTIDLLRFPLALAVIFIHLNPQTISIPEASFPILSGDGIYNIFAISISNVLALTAVPTFFFISGFLFFCNFPIFTWAGYKKKIKSRIKTLIIPYFVWNTIVFSLIIISQIIKIITRNESWNILLEYIRDTGWHIFYDCHIFMIPEMNLLGMPFYMTGPIDAPLWFLRDLIIVVIFSPLIYYFLKYTSFFGILFLFTAYITRIWISLPGFSITAFFFFSLGAYFALHNKNIIIFSRRYGKIYSFISIVLFLSCVWYNGKNTTIGSNIIPIYTVSTIFLLFNITSIIVEKYRLKANPILLKSCFFVYASHAVYILSLTSTSIHHIIYGNDGIDKIICYILTPFITAGICVFIYYILTKYFPKIALPLTGFR